MDHIGRPSRPAACTYDVIGKERERYYASHQHQSPNFFFTSSTVETCDFHHPSTFHHAASSYAVAAALTGGDWCVRRSRPRRRSRYVAGCPSRRRWRRRLRPRGRADSRFPARQPQPLEGAGLASGRPRATKRRRAPVLGEGVGVVGAVARHHRQPVALLT
jgi:hypothetical protein